MTLQGQAPNGPPIGDTKPKTVDRGAAESSKCALPPPPPPPPPRPFDASMGIFMQLSGTQRLAGRRPFLKGQPSRCIWAPARVSERMFASGGFESAPTLRDTSKIPRYPARRTASHNATEYTLVRQLV
ncbi:hypothetical protein N657DRAFT_462247 [Parathielavia appendiculata]|uniref:Uncharacterized protein n=1 Tax=Parathielavia appendiculata TaxID=2587402 RepID=A0AAN6TZA2_9PEZI|nr:hypothetical protein N657DRAFT_462247 [Parathielavia appendiculata]